MSLLSWVQSLFGASGGGHANAESAAQTSDQGLDSLDAVRELSRLFTADGDDGGAGGAAEISLALGNLFRAQGDIDRAVALREAALSHPETDRALKARTYFELGRDYRTAGFFDRALEAFKEARKLAFAETEVSRELARLYADAGDFTAAAGEYALLGMPFAEAWCMVKEAEEKAAADKNDAAVRLLKHAASVCPGSPEAWGALAAMSLMGGDTERCLAQLHAGLEKAVPSGRLILLEGLHAFARGESAPDIPAGDLEKVASGLSAILAGFEPDVTLCYYAGLFLLLVGRLDEAEQWFTKTLVMDPDFWAARLALLSLVAGREELPPLLGQQVAFFTAEGARSKRFVCPPCGLRRDTIFSQCPRCQAWHSAAFRLRLT